MHGEVIFSDGKSGLGFIRGADGNRYAFAERDLAAGPMPPRGTKVKFEADGANARRVAAPDAVARRAPVTEAPQFSTPPRSGPAVASQAADGPVGPFGYFRACLTRHYADFRGRARRKEYWSFVLFAIITAAAAAMAGMMVDASLGTLGSEEAPATIALGALAALVLFVPGLAVTVRRIHDIGLSGWFILVALIPTVGNLIILVFSLIPSQRHLNRWGPPPAGIS